MSSEQISPLSIEDPPELARSCWFLTGATATGKTSVSLEMARRLDAEIISLDSMAIYRGMDIGTAKPSREVRQQVPHHLIDIVDPADHFSVSQYLHSALAKIVEIKQRGKQVLFVGGTALYLKVLLRGMFEGPPADWNFRKEIEEELREMGTEFLHQRLEMVDPVSADLIHPNDQRRMIRALEVLRLTGKPMSHWQMQFDQGRQADECRVFTLRHPRGILHERIEKRVEQMFELGLIDEVKGLLQQFRQLGKTASQAVGYREVIDHLAGRLHWQQTVEQVKSRTRKFARHQETWFRGLSECRMIDLAGEMDSASIAEHLIQLGREGARPEK